MRWINADKNAENPVYFYTEARAADEYRRGDFGKGLGGLSRLYVPTIR
jgi:hypothetical protein